MSQGTFSDLLIPFALEAFKRIFVQKIDFLPRSKPTVLAQKSPDFQVGSFYSFISLGISMCRKTPLGITLKCI